MNYVLVKNLNKGHKNLCYLKNITCHKCICKTAFRPESCFFFRNKKPAVSREPDFLF